MYSWILHNIIKQICLVLVKVLDITVIKHGPSLAGKNVSHAGILSEKVHSYEMWHNLKNANFLF